LPGSDSFPSQNHQINNGRTSRSRRALAQANRNMNYRITCDRAQLLQAELSAEEEAGYQVIRRTTDRPFIELPELSMAPRQPPLSLDTWQKHLDREGRVTVIHKLQKEIFSGVCLSTIEELHTCHNFSIFPFIVHRGAGRTQLRDWDPISEMPHVDWFRALARMMPRLELSQHECKTDGVSQRLRRASREPTASTNSDDLSGARGDGLPQYLQTRPKAACSEAEGLFNG
uniref:PH domain-containing protein n=1 Tax=Schistocephalus solidus TaxID=70667 RepID=A0A183TB28_SCHSO